MRIKKIEVMFQRNSKTTPQMRYWKDNDKFRIIEAKCWQPEGPHGLLESISNVPYMI